MMAMKVPALIIPTPERVRERILEFGSAQA
jgi:hypothetical protein